MKSFVLSTLVGAALVAASPSAEAGPAPEAAAKSESVFPYTVDQRKLENGLTVIVVPMRSGGLVSYRTVVRTGARDEYEKGVTGFAHFFEHMMFRGTKKYPADVYGEIITKIGADSNAYTSTDITVYQLDVAAEDLAQVAELESDRFMNLDYSEEVFRTEAGAVYGEYRKNRASPFFTIYEAIKKTAFDKHTYGHTTMGFVEDIKKMPEQFAYSRKFFDRYYRPENVAVIVAGDVDPDAAHALIAEKYGAWEKGYKAPKIKKEPKQKKARKVEVTYEGRTLPIVWVAFKGWAYAPSDRKWVASMVLADLAFGETSSIYKKLQLEKQLVQSIGGSAATDRDPGLWSVIAQVKDPGQIDAVLAEIDATIAHYRDNPPDAARLAALKSNMKYSFLMGLDTPPAVAGALASLFGIAGDLGAMDQLYQNLDAVTPEDVQAAAKELFVDKARTTAILRGEDK